MTLISRITRLVKADVHELLDCIEDPQAALRQAVRDMEEEVHKDELLLAELADRRRELDTGQQEARSSIADADKQIDAAFSAGEEQLAKTFIRKKLKAQKRLKEIDRGVSQLCAENDRLSAQLNERRLILADTAEKAALFAAARKEQTIGPRWEREPGFAGVSDDDVEIAFIQEKERRETAVAK